MICVCVCVFICLSVCVCVCVCDQCLCVFMSGFRRVSLVICSDLSDCQKTDDPQSMPWKNRCVCVCVCVCVNVCVWKDQIIDQNRIT